jgi:protein tyrosine/serine phosphatase
VPVFATKDYGPEEVAIRYKHYTSGTEGFVKAYQDIMNAGTEAYGRVFRYLAMEKPSPCLVHCTAGKDRTGVLVALLGLLGGVDHESVAREYALTDLGLEPLKPLFVERLLRNPALEGNREGVEVMVSSRRENMEGTIEMIEREFGGAEAYMKKLCGLSEEEVEMLRRNLRAV